MRCGKLSGRATSALTRPRCLGSGFGSAAGSPTASEVAAAAPARRDRTSAWRDIAIIPPETRFLRETGFLLRSSRLVHQHVIDQQLGPLRQQEPHLLDAIRLLRLAELRRRLGPFPLLEVLQLDDVAFLLPPAGEDHAH